MREFQRRANPENDDLERHGVAPGGTAVDSGSAIAHDTDATVSGEAEDLR